PHRELLVLPECEHDQILRMRQMDRFEHRPIGADHPAGGHRQGEADLALQRQGIAQLLCRTAGCRPRPPSSLVSIRLSSSLAPRCERYVIGALTAYDSCTNGQGTLFMYSVRAHPPAHAVPVD